MDAIIPPDLVQRGSCKDLTVAQDPTAHENVDEDAVPDQTRTPRSDRVGIFGWYAIKVAKEEFVDPVGTEEGDGTDEGEDGHADGVHPTDVKGH